MRLCLIFLPNIYNKSFMLHETYYKYGGQLPPHTLMLIAAAAKKHGHESMIIDCSFGNLTSTQALKIATDWSADALGISLTTYNLAQYIGYMNEIKKESSLPVIAGGWQFSHYQNETMTHQALDYGVIGEGDITIAELLDALEGKRTLDSVDGIIYRNNGKLKTTSPRQQITDLDIVPFPDRSLVDNSLYFHLIFTDKKMTLMMNSRGCSFNCIFCEVGARKYSHRSIENILEEINICVKEYGINLIDFQDATFNRDLSFAKKLCREIIKLNLGIEFIARIHVMNFDEELAGLMKEAGFSLVLFGIESGNSEILKRINKNTTPMETRKAVEIAKKAKLKTMGYFVIGLPGDTHETVNETIRFSLNLGLTYAQYTRLMPMPNTKIFKEYLDQGNSDFWREYTLNPESGFSAPLVDTSLTVEEANQYMNLAYKRFFLRPSKIFATLLQINSFAEFIRMTRVGISLLFMRK